MNIFLVCIPSSEEILIKVINKKGDKKETTYVGTYLIYTISINVL